MIGQPQLPGKTHQSVIERALSSRVAGRDRQKKVGTN